MYDIRKKKWLFGCRQYKINVKPLLKHSGFATFTLNLLTHQIGKG